MKTSSKILIFKIILMPYSFRTHVIMVLPNTPFFFVNMNCHNFWEDNAVFFQFPFSRYCVQNCLCPILAHISLVMRVYPAR